MVDGIIDWPKERRGELEHILQESFEGWYLRHSIKTLGEIEIVKVAVSSGRPVGLVMLKELDVNAGYVFYIAVARHARGRGVAGMLLDESVNHFAKDKMNGIFASLEQDNSISRRLFESRGFSAISFGTLSKMYGHLRAINMYRAMVVVPGEMLLYREL